MSHYSKEEVMAVASHRNPDMHDLASLKKHLVLDVVRGNEIIP
jgi:hypothetical protein